jgi:IS5 family transposase
MTGKDRKEKAYVFGYKLHIIEDCETRVPLTAVVKSANEHASRPFYELFPYVVNNFNIQYGAKFLGDSAYDSADIRKRMREDYFCGWL